MLFYQDTKLKGRKKNRLKVVDRHLIKVTKALIVSGPMAIFYSGDGKS